MITIMLKYQKDKQRIVGILTERTIVCKGITRGNMKKSFLSKSKCADVNTDTAYSACLAEKKLLEKTIERIDSQIRMLDSKIDSLKSSIRGCNSAISDANSQMRRSNWAMNYYG